MTNRIATRHLWFAFLLAASLGVDADAQAVGPAGAALHQRVAGLMHQAQVPGLALALIEDGRVHSLKTYGLADVAKAEPLRSDTVMYGASLTKAAFAHLALQLVDEGLFKLDDKLPQLLKFDLDRYPDFSDLADDPRWRRVTPRQLLSHSSGLLNWRWINASRKLDFKYEPGTRYVYSGEGLQLLQLVIEERSGQPLQALMQEKVFDRFDMRSTSMVWRDDFVRRTSNRYGVDGRPVGHARRTRARAAGSMDTTLEDFARFVAGVMRGEGLSEAARAELLKPQLAIVSPTQFPSHFPGETEVNQGIALAAGLGWVLYRSPLGLAMFKEGNDEGTNNFVLSFPGQRRAVLMLSNSSRADRIFFPLVETLYGRTCLPWFWMGYVPWDRSELREPHARERPLSDCPRGPS